MKYVENKDNIFNQIRIRSRMQLIELELSVDLQVPHPACRFEVVKKMQISGWVFMSLMIFVRVCAWDIGRNLFQSLICVPTLEKRTAVIFSGAVQV